MAMEGGAGCPTLTIFLDWHGVCDAIPIEELPLLFRVPVLGVRVRWYVCSYGGSQRMYDIRYALDSVGLTEIEIIRTMCRHGELSGELSWRRYGWCFDGGKDVILRTWAPDSVACVLVDDNRDTVFACWNRGLDALHCVRWSRPDLLDLLGYWRLVRMRRDSRRPELAEPRDGARGNSSEWNCVSTDSLGGSSTTAAATRGHWVRSSEASSERPPTQKCARLGQSGSDAAFNCCSQTRAATNRPADAVVLATPSLGSDVRWQRLLLKGRLLFRNEDTGVVQEDVPPGRRWWESF